MDLNYFSKKNKHDFNFIVPKIQRYITIQNTLQYCNALSIGLQQAASF